VVTRDIAPHTIVAGVPARIIGKAPDAGDRGLWDICRTPDAV